MARLGYERYRGQPPADAGPEVAALRAEPELYVDDLRAFFRELR